MTMETLGSPAMWAVFGVLVLGMLALDLGVFHRQAKPVSVRAALAWTGAWIGLAMLFNLGLYLTAGAEPALEFLTGFILEKSLSVDNLFVFLVVFSAFGTPPSLQYRVLFWGVLGAVVLRGALIALGAVLLEDFSWVAQGFGALLIFLAIRMLVQPETDVDPQRNFLVRAFRRLFPLSDGYRGGRFTVVEAGRRLATPLLLVLVAIEVTDVVFALDSIPAVFAITSNPFIVFTSNIFAVLGLRALYFALAATLGELRYLKVGLAAVLAFVGAKMLVAGIYEVPTLVSLGVIGAILGVAVTASLVWRRRPPEGGGRLLPAAVPVGAGQALKAKP